MFRHILIATDGSELSGKAVAQGLDLAKAIGAKATIVTVTEYWDAFEMARASRQVQDPIAKYEKNLAVQAEKILSAASERARGLGVACETIHVPDKHPAEGILDTAKTKGCDLIVMSSHGRRGIDRILLGSQAVKVLTYSTVPVLICK